jgi:hypothetical protein
MRDTSPFCGKIFDREELECGEGRWGEIPVKHRFGRLRANFAPRKADPFEFLIFKKQI